MPRDCFKNLSFNFLIKNLTVPVKQKQLFNDDVVNDKVFERFVRVLSRTTKHHVYLLNAAPQVRLSYVEKLAAKIVAGDVPEVLLNQKLLLIEGSEIIKNKDHIEIENQLSLFFEQIKTNNIILYIEDFHLLVTANFCDLITVYHMDRNEIKFIGGTDESYYDTIISSYEPLIKRFQLIST